MDLLKVERFLLWAASLQLLSWNACADEFSCSGKVPGYYADISSSCSSYLLCRGTSMSRGMLFSCPLGTKFQQRTLVCAHAYSINCQDSEKYFRNNERVGKKSLDFIDQKVKLRDEMEKKNRTKVSISTPFNLKKYNISENFISSNWNDLSGYLKPNKDLKLTKSHIRSNHSANNYNEDKPKAKELISNIASKDNFIDQSLSINSIHSGAFKQRRKYLKKIPFSRVVGVQSKTNNKLSPFMNFSDLLEILTKSSKPVRMIPLGVTSQEADHIRNQINIEEERKLGEKMKGKEKMKHKRHPRLIKQIQLVDYNTNSVKLVKEKTENEINENVLKIKSKPEDLDKAMDKYQIIYKSDRIAGLGRPKKVSQTTDSFSETSDFQIVNKKTPVFKVTPRGSKTGFLNRHHFKKISKPLLNNVKNKDAILSTKLQFGFTPLTKSSKHPSEIYFDPNIDTLQAPNEKKNENKNGEISQNYFTSAARSVNNSVRKQDRISNLNLLGIFDTRKYFFIPQNRRSGNNGIFQV